MNLAKTLAVSAVAGMLIGSAVGCGGGNGATPGAADPVSSGRQGVVQRQRRRSSRQQRQVLVQRGGRRQGVLQRLGPRGAEVLTHRRRVALRGAAWRSHLKGSRRPRRPHPRHDEGHDSMGYRERHAIPDLGIGVGLRGPHVGTSSVSALPWTGSRSSARTTSPREGSPAQTSSRFGRPTASCRTACRSRSEAPTLWTATYLLRLRALVRRVAAPWCSDHLCWTGAGGVDLHDLASHAVHARAHWRTWSSG